MIKIFSALLVAVFITGCNSKTETLTEPECTIVAGKNIPVYAVRTVRDSEIIKTYKTGRYIDPENSNIMHEVGEIYVVKRSPSWNLRPNIPVNSSGFIDRLQPVNIQLENMKTQQVLLANTNKVMKELGTQMLNNRKELQALQKAGKNRKSLQPIIDKINRIQQEIIKKLAELELSKK